MNGITNEIYYHSRHLCRICGKRFEEHAGPKNPDCPTFRCPGHKFPEYVEAKNKLWQKLEDEKMTVAIREFWNERQTTFLPV